MREDYEIKDLNSTCKMAIITSIIMAIAGAILLFLGGWKEIFYGVFFILGSFILVAVAISRKKTLNTRLTSYLEVKIKEYFSVKNEAIKFRVERKKKVRFSYVIHVNGYVNKEEFEFFMQKFKQELRIKMEHRLLRKTASSIK